MKSDLGAIATGQRGDAREYLTFRLNDEEYGIDILKVQEIRGYEPPTKIANAPHFLKGVMDLRGVIVPIIDLRLKFNIGSAVYNEFTVVIILNFGNQVMGAVVDSVSDVLALPADQIRPPPHLDSFVDGNCITGLGALSDRLIILIEIERLLSVSEMALLEHV
jgi:purine-binding chemotaxis protein CheW